MSPQKDMSAINVRIISSEQQMSTKNASSESSSITEIGESTLNLEVRHRWRNQVLFVGHPWLRKHESFTRASVFKFRNGRLLNPQVKCLVSIDFVQCRTTHFLTGRVEHRTSDPALIRTSFCTLDNVILVTENDEAAHGENFGIALT